MTTNLSAGINCKGKQNQKIINSVDIWFLKNTNIT